MRYLLTFLLLAVLAGCAKKAVNAVADTIAETLLPSDVSPVDGAAAGTATDAAGLPASVTP